MVGAVSLNSDKADGQPRKLRMHTRVNLDRAWLKRNEDLFASKMAHKNESRGPLPLVSLPCLSVSVCASFRMQKDRIFLRLDDFYLAKAQGGHWNMVPRHQTLFCDV